MQRMEKHRPEWERGDTLKSVRDVIGLGKVAVAELISKVADSLDTRAASAINRPEDEN